MNGLRLLICFLVSQIQSLLCFFFISLKVILSFALHALYLLTTCSNIYYESCKNARLIHYHHLFDYTCMIFSNLLKLLKLKMRKLCFEVLTFLINLFLNFLMMIYMIPHCVLGRCLYIVEERDSWCDLAHSDTWLVLFSCPQYGAFFACCFPALWQLSTPTQSFETSKITFPLSGWISAGWIIHQFRQRFITP